MRKTEVESNSRPPDYSSGALPLSYLSFRGPMTGFEPATSALRAVLYQLSYTEQQSTTPLKKTSEADVGTGIEPAPSHLVGRRSTRLSYPTS
jgi:hypothetical protein